MNEKKYICCDCGFISEKFFEKCGFCGCNCINTIELNAKDKLKLMFEKQWELQTNKGVYEKLVENNTNLQEYLNQNFLALHEEAVEIMRETAYKNPDYVKFGWKKTQQMNLDKAKDEIIDLWHFVMNISMAIGMHSDEFYRRYCEKNKINYRRGINGY